MLKDTYIRIRLTTDEKKEIKEAAEKTHSNMSELILNAIKITLREKNNGKEYTNQKRTE